MPTKLKPDDSAWNSTLGCLIVFAALGLGIVWYSIYNTDIPRLPSTEIVYAEYVMLSAGGGRHAIAPVATVELPDGSRRHLRTAVGYIKGCKTGDQIRLSKSGRQYQIEDNACSKGVKSDD